MNDDPFQNINFRKDIKRSFVPSKLFNKNKYNYDIINVNFNLKKGNLIQIVIKLSNGKKYEHLYIGTGNKNDKKDKVESLIDDLENMMIIDKE